MQDGQPAVAVSGELGIKPVPVNLPAKSPALHQTAADTLDYLCKKYEGTYSRRRQQDGNVVFIFTKNNGDVLSGRASDTMGAVLELKRKLEIGL